METKFVITHADHASRRDIVRLPEGQTMIQKSMGDDLYRALCVGQIHMMGSAYCVHLGDEPPFSREMMRDVRTELIERDPQWSSTPPLPIR